MQASLSYHEVMAAAEPVDRYHQGAGRDCPECGPDRFPRVCGRPE